MIHNTGYRFNHGGNTLIPPRRFGANQSPESYQLSDTRRSNTVSDSGGIPDLLIKNPVSDGGFGTPFGDKELYRLAWVLHVGADPTAPDTHGCLGYLPYL